MRVGKIDSSLSIYILIALISISILLLGGTSYSLIQKTLKGNKTYSMKTGNFLIDFADNNTLLLENSMPTEDSVAINGNSELTFSVTNKGDYRSSYSILIEEISDKSMAKYIRYVVNYGDGYNIENVKNLSDNPYIVQNKSLNINEKDTYNLKFWLSIDTTEEYASLVFKAKIKLDATIYNNKYATNVIEAVYGNNDEGVVSVSKTNELGNKTVREYRYSGNVSTNYVWFNCKDGYTSGEKNCERWRIVGSFYNNTGYASLKIVRLDALSKKYAYDSNGNNNYESSSIYKYLNTEYYKSLESSAKALILNTKWYIGSCNAILTPGELYDEEAKKTVMANVGLLSLSDYGYANSSSNWQLKITETNYKNSSWLYNENKQLLINATSDNSNNSYVVGSNIIGESVKISFLVRPSVYLRSDVSIINGLGTFNEPYELKINFPMK